MVIYILFGSVRVLPIACTYTAMLKFAANGVAVVTTMLKFATNGVKREHSARNSLRNPGLHYIIYPITCKS